MSAPDRPASAGTTTGGNSVKGSIATGERQPLLQRETDSSYRPNDPMTYGAGRPAATDQQTTSDITATTSGTNGAEGENDAAGDKFGIGNCLNVVGQGARNIATLTRETTTDCAQTAGETAKEICSAGCESLGQAGAAPGADLSET